MRITGGYLNGRHVSRPRSPLVRPITAKLVEALFDILGPVDGLTVVDAYAGTGTIGIEALSRGATRVVGIESLPIALRSLKANLRSLGLEERYSVSESSVEQWLALPQPRYNLIFAGPPFAHIKSGVLGAFKKVMADNSLLIVWHTSLMEPPKLDELDLIRSRRYGDSTLSFYKRA